MLIAAALLAVLTPAGHAAETVEEAYTGALGAAATWAHPWAYAGLVLFPNQEGSPFTDNGIRPIGGVRLNTVGLYSNVIVTPSDDVYGSGAAISVCFWNPDGDNNCNAESGDYPSPIACGPAALLGAPFAGDYVTVFLFTLIVEDDLSSCGGSTGSVVGDFF